MRIAFLINSLQYGGAELQLVTLAKGLHGLGNSVSVIVLYSDSPLESDLRHVGISVVTLNKQGRWDIVKVFIRLIRELKKLNPEIIHSYLGTANILSILIKPFFLNKKFVWGVRASNMELDIYGIFSEISYFIECKLSRFADLIISNSYAGKNYAVTNGFPPNKIKVISNGINTEKYLPDQELRNKVRKEWGISNEEWLIGLIGRLDPIKDYPTFIKAAALLNNERNDVKFVCVGNGSVDYQEELKYLTKELELEGKVIWAGLRKDMHAVYNALDFGTSTSLGEGFSNVICEGMACGVPFIATDVGDSAKIIGNTGVLIPVGSPEKLYEGWRSFLTKDKVELLQIKNEARERIANNFSQEKLFLYTLEVLGKLI